MNISEEVMYEALNNQQRRARARLMKRLAPKIKRGREKAAKRRAPLEKLKGRANKQAINQMKDKLAKGKSYSELGYQQRQAIDNRLKKLPKSKIANIARKLLPAVKQKEKDKFAPKTATKNEALNRAAEQFISERELVELCRLDKVMKRPHMMMASNNSVKYDKRFKMYKPKNKSVDDIIEKGKGKCESTGDETINFADIAELFEAVENLVEVAKIACLKCDEVSTAKAWAKNNDVCPKCNKSTQGVAESLDEAFKRGDEILHKKKGSHGKVVKTNTNGTVDVKWYSTKSTAPVSTDEIIKLNEAKGPSDKDIDLILRTMKNLENGIQLLDAKYGLSRMKAQALLVKRMKDQKNEAKKMDDDPCWDSHEMIGKKMKNGKEVPNCVPKESIRESLEALDEAKINKQSPLYKEYESLKSKPIKDLKRIYQSNHRLDMSGADFPGKADLVADILRDRHGTKRLKDLYNESLDEAVTWGMFNAAEMAKDFKQAKAVTLKSETKLSGCKVIPNSKKFDLEDEGIIPMLKFFSRGAKTKTVTVPAGSDIAIDTQNGYAYGMVGKEFFKYEIMKDAVDEPLKDLVEAKTSYKGLYNVVKDGKVINKQPMSTQQALDHYDSLGGRSKGYAVKPVNEEGGAGDIGTDELRKKYQKDTPNQDVTSESLEEAKKIGSKVQITKGHYKGKTGYIRSVLKGEYGNPTAKKFDIDLEDGAQTVEYTKDVKLVKEDIMTKFFSSMKEGKINQVGTVMVKMKKGSKTREIAKKYISKYQDMGWTLED